MHQSRFMAALRRANPPCENCPRAMRCGDHREACAQFATFSGYPEVIPPGDDGGGPSRDIYRRIFVEPCEKELTHLQRKPAALRTSGDEADIDHAIALVLAEQEARIFAPTRG